MKNIRFIFGISVLLAAHNVFACADLSGTYRFSDNSEECQAGGQISGYPFAQVTSDDHLPNFEPYMVMPDWNAKITVTQKGCDTLELHTESDGAITSGPINKGTTTFGDLVENEGGFIRKSKKMHGTFFINYREWQTTQFSKGPNGEFVMSMKTRSTDPRILGMIGIQVPGAGAELATGTCRFPRVNP